MKKLKWEDDIVNYLLCNGKTTVMKLSKNLKISPKILLETLTRLEEKDLVEKVAVKDRGTAYGITSSYRGRALNQLFYLNNIPKEEFCTDTISFKHSVFGLPSFDKLTDYEKTAVSAFLEQIEDALNGINNLKKEADVSLHVQISRLVVVLNLLLEHESKSTQKKFLLYLIDFISKLSKDIKLKVCQNEKSPYPQKAFHMYYNNYAKDILEKPKYSKKPEQEIALISTIPLDRTKIVQNNIELAISSTINESSFSTEKYKNRLAVSNLKRIAEIVWAGRQCKNGLWIKDELSVKRFQYHQQLTKHYSKEEIKFMLRLIKNLKINYPKLDYVDLEQFIIFQGFSEKGIWYNKDFYEWANTLFNKINWNKYLDFSINKLNKLQKDLPKSDVPPHLNYNEIILYLIARAYIEIFKPFKEKELAKGFHL